MALSEPRRDPENAERRVLQRFSTQSEGRVLDIGCGDGRLTWLLARSGGLVVGLDIDKDELFNDNYNYPLTTTRNAH